MNMKRSFVNFEIIIFLLVLANQEVLSGQKIIDRILWKSGIGNYNNYRIPSVLTTQKGTLLAFCEGREGGDSGDIDILLKRSVNNGKTWSEEMIVWDDSLNTCGNPSVTEDMETGRIWLFMTWNNGKDSENSIISGESLEGRIPYLSYSDDDGITWSKPENISSACKDPSWGWYATGPGTGIQIKTGKYRGRLVIPANHSYNDPEGKLLNKHFNYGSHVLFSDDHGKTWNRSKPIKPGCNESQVVELSDGSLVMNMRSYNNKYCRAVALSTNGGETWSEIRHDLQLVEPVCQATILSYGSYNGKPVYLFANPAVPSGRHHITIKVSIDDCKNWSNSKLVFSGPSAYSCLVKLANRNIGIFFECGQETAYETLRFISFPPDELFRQGSLIPEN